MERKRSRKLGERLRALKAEACTGSPLVTRSALRGMGQGRKGGTGGDSEMESPLAIYVRSHVGCTSASHTAAVAMPQSSRGPQPHRETALQGGQGPGLATTVQPLTSCVAPSRPRDPLNFMSLPLSLTEVTGGWRGPGEQRAVLDVAPDEGRLLRPCPGPGVPAESRTGRFWTSRHTTHSALVQMTTRACRALHSTVCTHYLTGPSHQPMK